MSVRQSAGFYAGSRILQPLTAYSGLPIDQVNFITCQFLALGIAYPFRIWLHPSRTSTTIRHTVELVLGIAMAAFCFGWQTLHLFAHCTLCLIVMQKFPVKYMHLLTFATAMSYLAITHIYRQMYDYGGYTLDITGPLMVMTQKLTSFAFSYHDGVVKKEDQLSKDQKEQMIKKFPTLLEFLSYMFYFHGIMCGPLCFYNDYIKFIDGRNFSSALITKKLSMGNGHVRDSKLTADPSPLVSILKKMVIAAVVAYLMIHIVPIFEPVRLTTPEFFERPFLSKVFFMYICLVMARQKYYFAWTLTEAVNHNAGLGFDGYDNNGNAKWSLIEAVNIWQVELGTSMKMILDHWNISTLVWLRRVVYDRAPGQKTLAVFLVSAFWHGFYPGYYFMFLTAALFTISARQVRRKIRPYFQTSSSKAFVYDCITWTASRVGLCYMTAPFVILEFQPSVKLYNSMFWFMHIIAVVGLLVLQGGSKRTSKVAKDSPCRNSGAKQLEVNANDGDFKKMT